MIPAVDEILTHVDLDAGRLWIDPPAGLVPDGALGPAGPRIDVLTIFPELLQGFLEGSLLGRARRSGLLDIRLTDVRDFASGRHRSVDDAPYGGGDGMVLACEPVVAALESVAAAGATLLALSPRGRLLDQAWAEELLSAPQIVLLCGRYAGFDQRILEETGARELSIGDYVLAGGEAAALVVIEAVTRLIPGVLGNPVSPEKDSFSDGLLEFPLYTRPRVFRGREVPEVLLSGDHAAITRYRRREALRLTRRRRPELLENTHLTEEDDEILREIRDDTDRRTDS
ncbi:MAG: tRNA (guanosine(37)-N1)-methyltransferase TrmD [Proteobacteria bacterium]|nr:tRNA (guanosine(37)-N1)-methyltransferase TrmD [Pseudomonadota bacterium]